MASTEFSSTNPFSFLGSPERAEAKPTLSTPRWFKKKELSARKLCFVNPPLEAASLTGRVVLTPPPSFRKELSWASVQSEVSERGIVNRAANSFKLAKYLSGNREKSYPKAIALQLERRWQDRSSDIEAFISYSLQELGSEKDLDEVVQNIGRWARENNIRGVDLGYIVEPLIYLLEEGEAAIAARLFFHFYMQIHPDLQVNDFLKARMREESREYAYLMESTPAGMIRSFLEMEYPLQGLQHTVLSMINSSEISSEEIKKIFETIKTFICYEDLSLTTTEKAPLLRAAIDLVRYCATTPKRWRGFEEEDLLTNIRVVDLKHITQPVISQGVKGWHLLSESFNQNGVYEFEHRGYQGEMRVSLRADSSALGLAYVSGNYYNMSSTTYSEKRIHLVKTFFPEGIEAKDVMQAINFILQNPLSTVTNGVRSTYLGQFTTQRDITLSIQIFEERNEPGRNHIDPYGLSYIKTAFPVFLDFRSLTPSLDRASSLALHRRSGSVGNTSSPIKMQSTPVRAKIRPAVKAVSTQNRRARALSFLSFKEAFLAELAQDPQITILPSVAEDLLVLQMPFRVIGESLEEFFSRMSRRSVERESARLISIEDIQGGVSSLLEGVHIFQVFSWKELYKSSKRSR